jgi:hypothetical protein
MSCFASIHLSTQNMENVGKLLAAGCCLATANALQLHLDNSAAVEMVLCFMQIVAADPNSRATYGQETPICAAVVECLKRQIEQPAVIKQGCLAMATIMNGNAFNRQEFGKTGACHLVVDLLHRYVMVHDVAHAVCRAIFALAAGSPAHKPYFAASIPLLRGITQDPSCPDALRYEASEALRYL